MTVGTVGTVATVLTVATVVTVVPEATVKLIFQHNSKTQIVKEKKTNFKNVKNSNCDKTQIVKL